MLRYYTRVCNFYYGNHSKRLVSKNKSIPFNGIEEISFDQIEIITRNSKKKIFINQIRYLPKLIRKKINFDLKKINFQNLIRSDDGIISLKSSKDFNCESPEFKFVTNKYLIEIVSRYLNCVPLLTNLSLWYSPNDKVFENSSQEYHLDHEDYKQVKGFLFINEIDLQSGPLNIINLKQSTNIQNLINYKMTKSNKRVNDHIIQDLKKKNVNIDENIITGKPGDLLLCDTSSCFHFGSRLGNKSRIILAFQYITPFGFSVDWNWKHYERIPFKDFKCNESSLVMKVLGNKI